MRPHNCHPLLWGLVQVLGIKAIVISNSTGIDKSTITRIIGGVEPTDSQKELLLMMLEECIAQIGRIKDKDVGIKALNKARKQYLRYIIEEYVKGLI